MIIKGGTNDRGANQSSAAFVGPFTTTAADGSAFTVNIEIGKLVTDGAGRLIVLGGKGLSGAPPNAPIGGTVAPTSTRTRSGSTMWRTGR